MNIPEILQCQCLNEYCQYFFKTRWKFCQGRVVESGHRDCADFRWTNAESGQFANRRQITVDVSTLFSASCAWLPRQFFVVPRSGLGRMAAWQLPCWPVGPPAWWAATLNVAGGSGTEEGAQGSLATDGGLYTGKLFARAPELLFTRLLMGLVCL